MTEVRSTELYVNTEGLYPNDQGTQFTRFKVDFLEAPFGVADDERLKIIPTSAFIAKNWDDLNDTNRFVRIFVNPGLLYLTKLTRLLLFQTPTMQLMNLSYRHLLQPWQMF